jgi:hypothetical protein
MVKRRCVYRFLVGKPEGKGHLEKPGVNGMDLQEVGFGGMDQAGSGEGQVTGTCECGNELSGSINEMRGILD